MYRIVDEPAPGRLAEFVVNPVMPLLALMLCGAWMGYPWFVFNAFAVGCHRKWITTGLAAIAFAGSAAIFVVLVLLIQRGALTETLVPYTLISFVVWKMGLGYYLYVMQIRSFQIYDYYILSPRRAAGAGELPATRYAFIIIVFIAFFGRSKVIGLFDSPFWQMVVG